MAHELFHPPSSLLYWMLMLLTHLTVKATKAQRGQVYAQVKHLVRGGAGI